MHNPTWLALGDETGDWDFETQTNRANTRGLALIVGRIQHWREAVDETIDGQTVAERMRQPLRHLPEHGAKSSFHHVQDAFKLGPHGLSEPLRTELRHNLAWLVGHRRLITVGFKASRADLYQRLTHSQDATSALAKAYAALLALVVPFLDMDMDDRLLLGLGLRSENPGTIAAVRSGQPQTLNSNNRANMDRRQCLSTLRDHLVGDLNRVWPDGQWSERVDAQALEQAAGAVKLNVQACKGLADLGASLLYIHSKPDWAELFELGPMANVHFVELREYLK